MLLQLLQSLQSSAVFLVRWSSLELLQTGETLVADGVVAVVHTLPIGLEVHQSFQHHNPVPLLQCVLRAHIHDLIIRGQSEPCSQPLLTPTDVALVALDIRQLNCLYRRP